MKRILFITGGSDSGSEHNLFSLIRRLKKEDVEINILTKYNDYRDLHQMPAHRYYSEESFLKSRMMIHRVADRIFYNNQWFPFTRFFHQIIRATAPDLIYLNQMTLPGYYDYFLSLNIPYILHSHSLQQYYYSFPFEMIENRIKKAKLVISSSQKQKEVIQYLCPKVNPEILYPPVNIQELPNNKAKREEIRKKWGVAEDTFVWFMASTYFNYNKDPDRFVEIASRLIQQSHGKVFFVWIGGSQEATAVKLASEKIRNRNLQEYFVFMENRSHEDYLNSVAATDGCLLVSLEESFSIVTAESIAMGKPVVAFDCGGVGEIITPVNGILVEPFSFSGMCQAATEIMNRSKDFKKTELMASVERFNQNTLYEKWKELLYSQF